jgi:protocatechuate 3,4-dioxygenase beta subunit
MTEKVRATAVALAVGLSAFAQLPRDRVLPPEPTGTAVLAGRVAINVNGSPQPVRRARVTLEADVFRSSRTTDTHTDGRYRFANLPAGSYRVRAAKAGFVPYVRDPRRTFERPAPVDLADAQSVQHDLWMTNGAALEGQILMDTGAPAINVVVAGVRVGYDVNGRRSIPVAQARTDDRGRYRVHTLPAGEYYLEAGPDPLDLSGQPRVPGQRPTTVPKSFYPGVPRIDVGRTIALVAGQTVQGLNISLSAVPATALRGRIVDSTGKRATDPFARVQRVGGPVGEVRGSLHPEELAKETGYSFDYPRVPAGEYWVMGVARPSPTADLEFAAERVVFSGQASAEITLTTARGAVVNGRVVVEGDKTLSLQTLQVVSHPTEFELPALLYAPATGQPEDVAPDGTFFYKSLFGPQLMRIAKLPVGWALKSATLDGVEIADTPVDFRGVDRPRELRMIVTSRTGTVSGLVRDAAGRPAPVARVVVFAADERSWGFRSRMIKAAESDANGRYAIQGLLGGRYHVVAVPHLEEYSWMDATILRRLQPPGEPLAVGEAAHLTVDLVVK